jgi:phosphatidylglycerophosphate synthase
VIKDKLGGRIDGWIEAVFPFLLRTPIDPNLLTVTGTVVSIGSAAAFAWGAFPLGGVLLLAGGFFDLVDGVVARHHGRSTPFGAFLDSTLDRLVDMAVLLAIIAYYGAVGEVVAALLAGVTLVSSVLTSYAKARAELYVPSLGGGIFERGERVGLLVVGAVFGVMIPVLWVLAAGTTLTFAQRFALAYRVMDGGGSRGLDTAPSGAGEEP